MKLRTVGAHSRESIENDLSLQSSESSEHAQRALESLKTMAVCFNEVCRGGDEPNLLKCGRCKLATYCGPECQKKDWGRSHKHRCVAPDVARHEVKGSTIAAIQKAINEASPGDVVLIEEGTYNGPQDTLIVDKPLWLWGSSKNRDAVVLKCNLSIRPSGSESDAEGIVVAADFVLHGTTSVSANQYKTITLCGLSLQCPHEVNDDALIINDCKGKCLVLDCEVLGGSDGVFIASDKVHLKRTSVQYAQSRGIFSRKEFVIEDCTVRIAEDTESRAPGGGRRRDDTTTSSRGRGTSLEDRAGDLGEWGCGEPIEEIR
ncbi:hypothetical protein ACHAWF_010247 [Thalassiosira exigua]